MRIESAAGHTLVRTLLLAIACVGSLTAEAQSAPVVPPQQGEWCPQGVASLGQNASSRTEFTLDRSMIVLASKLSDQDDSDLRRVVAGLNGISVHSFRFPAPGVYDPAAIESLRQQYHAAGWQHLVSGHNKGDRSGVSDLWIRMRNAEIEDIAVLVTSPTQLNFFSVSGALRPLDVVHLSGHFGIPKFDGGTMVPDNRR